MQQGRARCAISFEVVAGSLQPLHFDGVRYCYRRLRDHDDGNSD
jgi:hypothetical protein